MLDIPRQRLDASASALPRALKANTHAHFRRFAASSSKLTLRVLRGQVAQARHHLTISGERLSHCTRALLRSRRERYAGLEARLKASRLANAQAHRNAIAREFERTERLAERAERAMLTLLDRLEARMLHSGQLLTALSYRSVLARGFALVRNDAGHPLHAAADVAGRRTAGAGVFRWTGCGDRRPRSTCAEPATKSCHRSAPAANAEARGQVVVDQGSLF